MAGHCPAWNLDFMNEGMREVGLEFTTASGCALGVKHPRAGKLFGRRCQFRFTSKQHLDRVTLSCKGDHQRHEAGSTFVTFGIPFSDALAKRPCGALLNNTSGEEVVRFIATAAGTGNDDHQVEVAPREAAGPRRNREVNPSSSRTSLKSLRKSWNCFNDT